MQEQPFHIQFTKDLEGFSATPYKCSAGTWTIGYGSTSRYKPNRVKSNSVRVSHQEADKDLLIHFINEVYPYIDRYVKVDLNKNQYDALASFVYNIGSDQFMKSTMLKRLNQGDYKGAGEAMLWFNKVTDKRTRFKVISSGLIKRRNLEKSLFDKPVLNKWEVFIKSFIDLFKV